MAWQQWRTLDAQRTHTSDAATYSIKLPRSNILHSLVVLAEMTNGSTNNQGNGLSDAVDSIKIIGDGSQVIASLEPETVRMLHLYNTGHNLTELHNEVASTVQRAAYPIMFGRDWFDPSLYLPLDRFSDLELQITYSPTIAATGWTTGTFKTTVLGLVSLEGAPGQYQGTLVSRIIENFTTVASGDQVVNPPQRWPWRGLFVRCYEAAIEDGVDITDVQFDLNDEQRVPLNLSWTELHDLNQSLRPVEAIKRAIIQRADTDTVATLVSRIRHAGVTVFADAGVAGDTFVIGRIDTIAGDTLTLNCSLATIVAGSEALTAYTTDEEYFLSVVGEGLPYAVFVPLNVMDAPPYFDSKAWDEVNLTLTQGAAGGDCDVVLQESQMF